VINPIKPNIGLRISLNMS